MQYVFLGIAVVGFVGLIVSLINLGRPKRYKYRIIEKENAQFYGFQAQHKSLFSSWENCGNHRTTEADAHREILKDIEQRQQFRDKWHPKVKRVIKVSETFNP